MAKCTNVTFLMHKESSSAEFSRLIDITEYPDLGGAAEMLDASTLSHTKTQKIKGVEDSADLEFKAWFDLADYKKLYDIEKADKLGTYQLWFGENGEDGIWEWQGKLHVYVNSGGQNAVREMSFTISDEGEEPLAPVFKSAVV